ncbi:hypothetical protein C1637_05545 [Chryseobacterium lactis]|uniref:Bacteriocin n=1 Tax=Chryseobacterium lactis TaxID=1241981 RepID=A0A3G6RRM9_CHRLC|nr:bacteriocin [Chryseobacterium lactis]AZA84306.1 bacteriocin [Chryseobacterium lactis]AZB04694.1 bacteriocin [Chryseobacterium lactis]PNW14425.1 hypothetical protein C1637_05545 [Chryseobacterium lactis]
MKKVLALKKLTKKELKQISGGDRPVCCKRDCATDECIEWGSFPTLCPITDCR